MGSEGREGQRSREKRKRETERERDPEEELERLGGKAPLLPVGLCLPVLGLPSSPLTSPLHS